MMITPNRGEVWSVQFDPQVGEEIGKTRPAVVVSDPHVGILPLRIVVPLTHWQPRYSDFIWFIYVPSTPENGLSVNSGADVFQIKSVALARFRRKIGTLTADQMTEIAAAIALCVGY